MPQPLSKEQKQTLISLGETVKHIRQQKGLTLEEVAFKVGKDKQSIHRLEKGNFNPSYIYLLDVCRGLGVNISDLLK